jgi:endonuclease/exonuclease/phosphatase family metal-dependent hydrolase
LNQILKRQTSPFNYCSKYPAVTITVFTTILEQNSSYAKQSNDDILDSIERDIVNKYMNNGDIVLCGDLNARSGSEPYFIQNDSYGDHVPVNEDYECDIVQEKRNSYDNKLDARGRPLLELCVTTKMRILNGRVIGDLFGKYTCHKPTGSSVVDYIILSEELLTSVLYFKVSDFIPNFPL